MGYEDIRKVFKYLDLNGDGVLNYEEFCELSEENWKNKDFIEIYKRTSNNSFGGNLEIT